MKKQPDRKDEKKVTFSCFVDGLLNALQEIREVAYLLTSPDHLGREERVQRRVQNLNLFMKLTLLFSANKNIYLEAYVLILF